MVGRASSADLILEDSMGDFSIVFPNSPLILTVASRLKSLLIIIFTQPLNWLLSVRTPEPYLVAVDCHGDMMVNTLIKSI
jgi:hypothetical protein